MAVRTQHFISAAQIRAARGLLNWSQDKLAEISGLSVATIRKIELGHISPRSETTGSIIAAFENTGLEFIEPDGVRHRPEDIRIYQGREGFRDFYDDIHETAKKSGEAIVVVCASEIPFNEALGDEFRLGHYERMTAIKSKSAVKCIVTEDTSSLPATAYCEYRCISKHYVDSVPFYVYGDKYAIIMFEADPSPKVTVIESRLVADAFRRQFYSMWDKATPISPADKNVLPMKAKKP